MTTSPQRHTHTQRCLYGRPGLIRHLSHTLEIEPMGGDANGNGGIRPLVAVTELPLAICAPTVRCTGCGNPTCMGRRAGVASRLERDERVSPAHQDRRLAAWEPARTASCVRIDTELADAAIAPAVRDAVDRQTARMP